MQLRLSGYVRTMLIAAPVSVSAIALLTSAALADARCMTNIETTETGVVTSVDPTLVNVTGAGPAPTGQAVIDTTIQVDPFIGSDFTTDNLGVATVGPNVGFGFNSNLQNTTGTFLTGLPDSVEVTQAVNPTMGTAIATVTPRYGEGVNGADNESSATGANAFGCGPGAVANGENASAFGEDAQANGESATAIGQNAQATTDNATAVGQDAAATGANATAVGEGAIASGENTTAVGQGATATETDATAIGQGATASGEDSTAVGRGSTASAANSTAIGEEASATGGNSVAVGEDATASANGAIAVGQGSEANAGDAIAIGEDSTASGFGSTVVGTDALATGTQSTALGVGSFAEATNSTAVGAFSDASGSNSTAVGFGSEAFGTNSTALGNGTSANFSNSTALGNGATATRANEFVLGNANNTYTAPGITSAASAAQQTGPLEVVTTDANGHLASDGGEIFSKLGEHGAGIAIAVAMENPDLVGTETFGLAANIGFFDGNTALALSAMGVIGHDLLGGNERWAVSGGVGVSLNENNFGGQDADRTVAGRAGVQVSW